MKNFNKEIERIDKVLVRERKCLSNEEFAEHYQVATVVLYLLQTEIRLELVKSNCTQLSFELGQVLNKVDTRLKNMKYKLNKYKLRGWL